MRRITIITNIASPYRVDLFYFMQHRFRQYEIHIIYTSKDMDGRQWDVDRTKISASHFLDSKVIKIRQDLDDRYVHIPIDTIRTLDRIDPDVVIAGEYNLAALLSMFWCRTKKKRFIHMTDGTLISERSIGKLQKMARKTIIRHADACIASSTRAGEKLRYYGARDIFQSLLTVDIERYRTIERNEQPGRILYVGSMAKRKGVDLLIAALPYIRCGYELHIVGNGTDEEIRGSEQQAKTLGVKERITWCGFKEGPDLYREYSEAAVFVLPTREDCFGLVLLEALCARVPIVASMYADGAYDVVVDKENGYIVDPYSAENLGGAIGKLLSEDETREAMSRECEGYIDRFTFENVSEGYRRAIEFVCKDGK